MINQNELAAYTSSFSNLDENAELQERLKLYQAFSKLYDYHRGLLNEILELENSGSRSLARIVLPYIQGFVSHEQPYLVTNLLGGQTHALTQPQQTWVIGRDPQQASILVQDIRLSRCHAAIQHVVDQGFYLIDLGSRNQSLVNGEPIRQILLKDGDQIRMGSLSFTFFLCHSAQVAKPLSPEILAKLAHYQSQIAPSETAPSETAPSETAIVEPTYASDAQDLKAQDLVQDLKVEDDGIPTLDLYHDTSGFLRDANPDQRSF